MSSDNLFLIRKDDGKFVVTMEFASDEYPRPLVKRPDGSYEGGYTQAFDTWEEANEYAHSEYSEYGVEDLTGVSPEELAVLDVGSWKQACSYARWENEQLRRELEVVQRYLDEANERLEVLDHKGSLLKDIPPLIQEDDQESIYF